MEGQPELLTNTMEPELLDAAPLRLIAAKDIAAGDVVELVSAFVPVEDDCADASGTLANAVCEAVCETVANVIATHAAPDDDGASPDDGPEPTRQGDAEAAEAPANPPSGQRRKKPEQPE